MAIDAFTDVEPQDESLDIEDSIQPGYPSSLPGPGELVSFDVSQDPIYIYDPTSEFSLTREEKNALQQMAQMCSRTDIAARRFEVEQAWEARLFSRGYQHLLPRKGGGWSLPGDGTRWGVNASSQGLYSTNIYGSRQEIIVSALTREVPKVQFFPKCPGTGPDEVAASAANKYKYLWSKTNDLRERMVETAGYMYTEDRAVLYTRSVADAQAFAHEDPVDFDGEVPETEMDPSPSPSASKGQPNIREVTSVFGKLEAKVPIQAQSLRDMHFVQIFQEVDVTTAKARYPWIANKIKPSSSGSSEVQLDRMARINTKLALEGSYITGDSLVRDVTEGYTWVRPSMYYDDQFKETRDSFLQKFPDGCLIAEAGTEFAFARNESMDDHLVVIHPGPGNGQNRRALGANNISTQKRLNNLLDLQYAYFVRTVPSRYYDSEAFDMEALAAQSNNPGASYPVQRIPGVSLQDLFATDPAVTAQPALPDFVQWFANGLPEILDGATPALFGAATNTDTVGGISIQRDQALQRFGVPWNAMQVATACSCRQAVQCAARNNRGKIDDTIPGTGRLTLEVSDLKGNVLCYPEYDSNFPESWTQREQRFVEIVQGAATNAFYSQIMSVPSNAKVAKDALRMNELTIPGAASVEKQEGEFEVLLKSGPAPNTQLVELEQELDKIQAGVASDTAQGIPIPPEGAQAVQAIQQAMQALPQYVSTVPVMQDASEFHSVEADRCVEWLNSQEGREYKNGDENKRLAWQNVHLHWMEHCAMVKKLAPPPAPAQAKYSVNIAPDKLPGPEAAAVLSAAGIQANPVDFDQDEPREETHDVEVPLANGGKVKSRLTAQRSGSSL